MQTEEHKGENNNLTLNALSDLESQRNDLAIAADLGHALLANNEELQREHQAALEVFRQRIHELETERRMLQLRLETVENDYEMQIKELHNNINSMRIDVQMQKNMYRQLENDRLAVISELTQQNQSMAERIRIGAKTEAKLKQEISQLRSQCNQRKSSMHDNLQLIELLRREISKLRSEKVELESKLQSLTEERNHLLETLSDCNERVREMEQVEQEQLATIHSQDNEIAHLQERANQLQAHLHALSVQKNHSQTDEHTSIQTPQTNRPHHSLLAELAEQRLELFHNAPFELLNGSESGIDDDDGVEMDDETLLAYVNALNAENGLRTSEPIPSTSNHTNAELGDGMITELRSEVAEIYQQMRQMCAELQALSNAKVSALVLTNGGGTHTPDDLAMVEMDFRLSSLRSVLGDLRGLLKELITDSVSSGNQNKVHKSEHGEQSQTSNLSASIPTYPDEDLPAKTEAPLENCLGTLDQDPVDLAEAMINERDILADQVASVQQQLSALKQQVENESQRVKANRRKCTDITKNRFLSNWQELDDDEYEFELPQNPEN